MIHNVHYSYTCLGPCANFKIHVLMTVIFLTSFSVQLYQLIICFYLTFCEFWAFKMGGPELYVTGSLVISMNRPAFLYYSKHAKASSNLN